MSSSTVEPHPYDQTRDEFKARFEIHSRTEILFLLNAIKKRNLLVNLDLPGSRQIVVTSIIDIDKAASKGP